MPRERRPILRCRERGGAARRRDERGAGLVEFVLIMPILFAIVFGIVDFGIGYNDWVALRQGAREGVRQAVTGRVGTDTGCPIQAGSPAFPANSQVNQLVCLVKDRTEVNESDTAVKVLIEGSYADKRSMAVCVMARVESATGLYSALLDNVVLKTTVQMKIEQTVDEALANGKVLAAWQEAPLTGGDWSFCTVEATS
jgi:Flp pilus assembly protein TadG